MVEFNDIKTECTMNIHFIITSLQNHGGTERVVTTLANHIVKKYNVTIISQDINGKKNAYYLDPAVKDIKFPKGNIRFLLSAKKYTQEHKPDYIVIHTMSKLTPLLLLCGVKGKNIWSMEHISYEFHSIIFKILRGALYNRLDKILVFTEGQKQIYSKFNRSINIVKNPCPLDITSLPYNNDSKSIVTIGRLTSQKGYDLLIESWALIENKHPDWSLNIYGEGEDKKRLKGLIKKHCLKKVYLKGHTSNVSQIYDSASFYVMSSRYEGLPMVLIEAQARGLPIVSFDCPTGPKEIVEDNITGLLVPSTNVNKLSEAIEKLISNVEMRQTMSNNAKETSKQFLTTEVVKTWVNLFES